MKSKNNFAKWVAENINGTEGVLKKTLRDNGYFIHGSDTFNGYKIDVFSPSLKDKPNSYGMCQFYRFYIKFGNNSSTIDVSMCDISDRQLKSLMVSDIDKLSSSLLVMVGFSLSDIYHQEEILSSIKLDAGFSKMAGEDVF